MCVIKLFSKHITFQVYNSCTQYIAKQTGVSSTFLTDRFNANLANFSGKLTQNLNILYFMTLVGYVLVLAAKLTRRPRLIGGSVYSDANTAAYKI